MTSSLTNPKTPGQYIQAAIISILIDDLIAAGWLIDVNDNDGDRETHLSESQDKEAIMGALFSDEIDARDWLFDLRRADRQEAGVSGWVRLIDGNDATVISDYTTNLDSAVERANKLADEIDTMGDNVWTVARLLKAEEANKRLLAFVDLIASFTPPGRDAQDDADTLGSLIRSAKILNSEAEG